MIILGIDPGLATLGFGLLDAEPGRIRHLRHGVIKTPAHTPLSQRLLTIADDLTELIGVTRPDCMAVEELFFGKNATTGIAVSHARGIILMTAARHHLPIYEYKPMQVKLAVVGYGGAEKRQVMEMTRNLLRLEAIPRPDDAADALAVALCHAHIASAAREGKLV